jgi:hypothetical protein
MIALQFLHYKYADRFFYENNLPTTGFNIGKPLKNIDKSYKY